MRIRTSRFPTVKSLEDFNLDHLPSLGRDVLAIWRLECSSPRKKTSSCSAQSIDKTHLAIGLGVKAAYAGYSVLFDTASHWITRLSTRASYRATRHRTQREPPLQTDNHSTKSDTSHSTRTRPTCSFS
ncbi:ATP-binding protein [Rhodococcus sp. NPDC060176]|uniref:ATP-binding protein n=1 Tax=Rhodococcus sp. NPDC060176 TaxID=3347062 RepID=UPI00365B9DFE